MKFKKTPFNKLTQFTIFLAASSILLMLVINSNALAAPNYGNALPSDLLLNKTATTDAGAIVGTMPERGSPVLQPGDLILSGHYTGGSVAVPGAGGSTQVFTTPGTYNWIVPSGVTRIMVAFVGGGGGSAACSYPGAGAGGGIIFANVIPGQVIPYTIGAGGAGGIYAADGNGCIFLAGKGSNGTATTVLGFTGGGGGGAIDALSGGAGGVATAPGSFNGFYYIAPGANARYVDGQQGSGLYISTPTNVGASSGGQGGTGGSGPIAGIGGTGSNVGSDGGIGGGGGGNWLNYQNGHKGGNGAVKFYW